MRDQTTEDLLTPDLLAQLAACQRDAAHAQSLPPAAYVNDAFAKLEQDRIFRGSWFGIGRSDRFATEGDFETLDVAGQSIIVLRDREGVLRAFSNSCRHRGARLLEGAGNCRGIRCPFHAWAYKLDGSLAGAPHMEDASDFDRSAHGLVAYRAEERLGFAFLCLDQHAPDLDETLGDFAALHAPWPIEALVTTRRRSQVVDCNWKAFLEVFNEYYHLPFVHRDSINDVYKTPEPGDVVTGAYASQFGSTEGTGSQLQGAQMTPLPMMPGMKGREAAGVRYTWVFPNMAFAACVDAFWIYEAYPMGPNQCLVFQTSCFPAETIARPEFQAQLAAFYHRLDAALAEDVPALINQHRGLSSPDARPGRFQPRLEPNVAAFANWYAGKILADGR